MTPTQAQIEAAIGAYGVVLSQAFTNDGASVSVLRDAMSAALAAAAEVGQESTMEHIARDIKAGIFPRKSESGDAIKAREHLAALENVKAITIERCAQVADEYDYRAARAIRALKDKP